MMKILSQSEPECCRPSARAGVVKALLLAAICFGSAPVAAAPEGTPNRQVDSTQESIPDASERAEDFNDWKETTKDLTSEFVYVKFEPMDGFRHEGHCPLRPNAAEDLTPGDIMVIVDEECLGFVEELILLSRGFFEFSVDAVGAETVLSDVRNTTSGNPKVIIVSIVSEED